MIRVLNNAQMRRADEYTVNELKISSRTLMRRAGLAIAGEVQKSANELCVNSVLVVCGPGNNGGDGYVCAEQLLELGYNVKVYAADGKLSPDCEREKAHYKGGYSQHICGDIIVDCLFGTGLCRPVCGNYAGIVNGINGSGAFVISADIPSGLNGDNGKVLGVAVKAYKTVAVAEYKSGFFLGDGMDYCGEIVKADIGITCPDNDYAVFYADSDIKNFYPERRRNSHKGTYGCANLVAGSEKYTGAAALCAAACLKSGCGYTKLTSAECVKYALTASLPQVIFNRQPDFTANAIAIGCGSGVSRELYNLIDNALKNYGGTLVIDADGLNSLSEYDCGILKNAKCSVILTPHIKEFSRLTGLTTEQILQNPVAEAQRFACEYGVTMLLKNAASIITDGKKTVFNVTGSTALAKGGSGDMLAGFMCGTVARGVAPFDAAVCAAYTFGKAAEIAAADKTDYCATAEDILNCLHLAIKSLTA